jgi:hypothetical protein
MNMQGSTISNHYLGDINKKVMAGGTSFPGHTDSSSCDVYTCLYANRIALGQGLEMIQSILGATPYRMYMHSLFFPFLEH